MTSLPVFGLVFVWLIVLGVAIGAVSAFERRARLMPVARRAAASIPRSAWGGGLLRPPADSGLMRALAFAARCVRSGADVEGDSTGVRIAARALSLAATLSGLALLPVVSGWGASVSSSGKAKPLVLFDSEFGLALIVFLVLVSGLAHTVAGLAERNEWARLAAVRIAGSALAGVALLLLLFAPIVLSTGSFRLSEIASAQLGSFAPLSGYAWSAAVPESVESVLGRLRLPNWLIFRQPLTAVLAIPTLGLLLSRSLLVDGRGHSSGPTGYGLDADPSFLYQAKLESRVAEIFAAALFVTLFLGGSGLPVVDARMFFGVAEVSLGAAVVAFLLFVFEVGVFLAKLLGVLFAIQLFRRTTGVLRIDQNLEIVTRRLLPLVLSNALLMSALALASGPTGGAFQ